MDCEIDWEKWSSGVRMVLYNWPLLRGAVEIKFHEYENKKLYQVKDYIDVKKYNFSNMSNEEIECMFAKEICLYLIEWETDEIQLQDFMTIFVNEVFDCMPDKTDKSHKLAARSIIKLFEELNENENTTYEEILEFHQKNSGGIKFVKGVGQNDVDAEEEGDMNAEKTPLELINEKNDSSTASAPGPMDNEFSDSEDDKPKKKKKKNVTTMDMDDEDKPVFIEEKDNEDSDDDWVKN